MKVLFTADIHIKLGQKNVPVDWAINRYNLLGDRLVELSEQVDLIIVGGDIFDRAPTTEEMEVYYDLVAKLPKPTIIYSGNHEANKKTTTFLSHLKKSTSRNNSLVTIIDTFATVHGIDFIPYNMLKQFVSGEYDYTFEGRILCTHIRGEIPPHVKPEIDLDLVAGWDVVLAGDLHSYTNSQANILYPGSPVTTSFHRSEVDTGVIIFDTESLEHTWEVLNLPQLLRKTVAAGEELVPTSYHHTIYDIEGDMAQLAGVEDNDLIDKKINTRSAASEAALILEPEMTLEMEVSEYLRYILELRDDTVESAIKELGEYNDEIYSI